MGQQPRCQLNMNPNAPARSSGYHQKAMEEIQNSLRPFAKSGSEAMSSSAASTISNFSATSGVSSLSSTSGGNGNERQLVNMGYSEVSWKSVLVKIWKDIEEECVNMLYFFLSFTFIACIKTFFYNFT